MKYFLTILMSFLVGAIIFHYAIGEDSFKYSGKLQADKTIIKAPYLLVPSYIPYYPGIVRKPGKPDAKRTLINVIGEASEIYVKSGQKVKKGQKLATIKNPLFNYQLIMNQSAEEELDAGNQELENNKAKIYDAKSKLRTAQSELASKLSGLKSNRDKLQKKLQGLLNLKKQLSNIPKVPPVTKQSVKAAVPPTLPVQPSAAGLDSGIAQLQAVLAKMDSGISMMESALGKLPEAKHKLSDASGEINDYQKLMDCQKNALSALVDFSRDVKDRLTLRAPASGTITAINIDKGDTICANQPLFDISETNEMKVVIPMPESDSKTTYKNKKAVLRVDGVKRYFDGIVTFISPKVGLATSETVTKEVHLMRTVNIEIKTMNAGGILKDGMPVDVKFSN